VKPDINSVEIHPKLGHKWASSGWCTGELLFALIIFVFEI
jgi:hypothetical protein